MSNFNSDQFANIIAVPPTRVRPNEAGGVKRLQYFEYTTPASAGPAAADTLCLCKLPRGARVTSLKVTVPASFVTSSAKVGYAVLNPDGTINTLIDDDRWGSGVDLSSAAQKEFLTVIADMAYKVLELTSTTDASYTAYNEVAVVLTFTTGNPGASKAICGHVEYVTV
jgi:hypothetical protein